MDVSKTLTASPDKSKVVVNTIRQEQYERTYTLPEINEIIAELTERLSYFQEIKAKFA